MSSSSSVRLDSALTDLLRQAPEVEAAAVVSFDGLPMASALPASMDEDRVAAMSAALLSLGERAAQGLGRGDLSQVFIEGEHGTVFLVSADDEAVLVAVAARGAKVGLMLYEVRRAAVAVAEALRESPAPVEVSDPWQEPQRAAGEPASPQATPSAHAPEHASGYAPEHSYAPEHGYALPDEPVRVAAQPTVSPEPLPVEPAWPGYAPQPNGSSPTWS